MRKLIRNAVAFKGLRTDKGCLVYAVTPNGKIVGQLDPRFDIRKHSPAGFEWGYLGSGPAQLALAMCCATLGDAVGSQPSVYQEFKRRIVSKLQHDNWSMLAEDIKQLPLLQEERNV